MYCKLLVDAYNTLLQVIHPWNRSYMSLLLLYVLTSNSPLEQVCSGIGDLVLVEGGLLRLLHRGWATSSTSRFMTVKFIWKNFYAVNFTFVEPTRLWITRLEVINVAWSIHFCWWWTSTNSQSSTSGRFSLAVINFSWGPSGCSVLQEDCAWFSSPTSGWGTPSPRHPTSPWTCSRMQWFRSCVIDFRSNGDWLTLQWMGIGWIYDHWLESNQLN